MGDSIAHAICLNPHIRRIEFLQSIEVSASVTLDGTTTAPAVESAFAERLGEYIRELAFRGYTLLYNRVAFFLLDIDGVVDYTSLSVNGGTGNVSIGAEQVPVLGEVSVT